MGLNMPPCSANGTARAQAGAAHLRKPERKAKETPFPWMPMVAISICLMAHAYALCSLFPYVGYMVQYLGIAEHKDEAGYYAGYLSSAFMVGRFAGSYFWGRMADRYGRLPVMYWGMLSMAVLMPAFGLSPDYTWAVIIRFVTGALNGIVANSKTMISEICGSEHEVVGMSFITGCWAIGLVLGSGLGGLLAEPAIHYPTMFSETGLFGRFPYLLPNVLGSLLSLGGIPLVYFFLQETIDVKKAGSRGGFEPIPTPATELYIQKMAADTKETVKSTCIDIGYDPQFGNASNGGAAVSGCNRQREPSAVGSNGVINGSSTKARADERLPLTSSRGSQEQEEGGGGASCFKEFMVPMKLLKEKRVRTILFVYVLFSVISFGCQEVYPLWALSTLKSGGLDWTTEQIGQALSICGAGMLIFQLLVYPRVVKHIGLTISQRWACCIAIPVYLSYPLLSTLHDFDRVLMPANLVLLFFSNVVMTAVVTNISLATNNAVPASQRGTVNGLAMTLGSLSKAVGPTVSATIFAWSINKPRPFPFDCHFVFGLFGIGMVLVTAASWKLVFTRVDPEPKSTFSAPEVVAEAAPDEVE